jgi:hypothetical protein
VFSSWSDGGAQQHTIVMGSTPRSLVATFTDSGPTPTYATEVLADTPIAYWRLGESSGTSAADSSGNNRNGTYVGAPSLGSPGLVTGDPNTSVSFNGTNQSVDVADAPAFNLTGDLTLEAVVNMTGGENYRTIVAKHDGAGDVSTYELRVQGSTGALQFVQRSTTGAYMTVTSNTTLAANTTYHIAATKSGSTVTLYINGVGDRTATFSSPVASNSRPLRIARRDGSKAFAGRIDEVAIYNKALTASRLAAHAALR